MNTYIAYDTDTHQILGFISNNYTTIEETAEVFQNFQNYDVIQTDMDIPSVFDNYKVKIENNILIGFEEMPNESINI